MDTTVAPLSGPSAPVAETHPSTPRLAPHETASSPGEASGEPDPRSLLERARQALTSQLQLEPEIADALALPAATALPVAPERAGSLMVQLAMDERTRRVVVRVIDPRTGGMLRELPSTALTAVTARMGRIAQDRSTSTRVG